MKRLINIQNEGNACFRFLVHVIKNPEKLETLIDNWQKISTFILETK